MSKALQSSSKDNQQTSKQAAGSNSSKSRKLSTKQLSTGQKVSLTPQDFRTLKGIYEYLSGFAKRQALETSIEDKRTEIFRLNNEIPAAAKIMMQQRNHKQTASGHVHGSGSHASADNGSIGSQQSMSSSTVEERTEADAKIDEYYRAKEQLLRLEERLKVLQSTDHKISFKDLEARFKALGAINISRKQIEQMIWEVDEKLDDMICYEEFLLTYFRNLKDTTGNEPNSFFRIQEFMVFDEQRKGYIIEDDCMEILYARYGGGNLERELKLMFGSKLRALGGDGCLTLEEYLASVLARQGRRALLF